MSIKNKKYKKYSIKELKKLYNNEKDNQLKCIYYKKIFKLCLNNYNNFILCFDIIKDDYRLHNTFNIKILEKVIEYTKTLNNNWESAIECYLNVNIYKLKLLKEGKLSHKEIIREINKYSTEEYNKAVEYSREQGRKLCEEWELKII